MAYFNGTRSDGSASFRNIFGVGQSPRCVAFWECLRAGSTLGELDRRTSGRSDVGSCVSRSGTSLEKAEAPTEARVFTPNYWRAESNAAKRPWRKLCNETDCKPRSDANSKSRPTRITLCPWLRTCWIESSLRLGQIKPGSTTSWPFQPRKAGCTSSRSWTSSHAAPSVGHSAANARASSSSPPCR